MRKIVLMGLLLLLLGIVRAQRFSKAEYFIDTDPGIGLSANSIAVSDTSDTAAVNLSFNVPLTSLGSGFHILNIRVMNKNRIWSIAESRSLFIYNNVNTTNIPGLVSYEYFIDIDSGIGKGTKGTLADTANAAFSVNLTGISPGIHILGIRIANSNNQWSLNETRSFYVYKTVIPIKTSKITSAEYFFDSDPGMGKGKPISAFAAKDSVSFSFNAPLDTLLPGFHFLFVRVKDSAGIWSMQETRNFYVQKLNKLSHSSPLVYMEYFIDTDPGNGKGISVPVSKGDSVTAKIAMDVSLLPLGNHTMTIRAKDSAGIWSIAETKLFSTCNSLVTPDFSASEDCAQSPIGIYNFSSGNLTGATFKWDFESDGLIDTTTTDNSVFYKKFPVGGTYNITLTVIDKLNCTAAVKKSLTVDNQPPAPTISPSGTVTFCQGSLGVKLTSSIYNIVWSPTNDTSVSILASNTGTYYATAMNPITGCSANSNIVTVIKGSLKPNFTFTVISSNKRVNFVDASIGADKWVWNFGDYSTGTGHTPSHIYGQSGAYRVCQNVYDTVNGCNADTCKLVRINVIDSTFAAFSYITGTGDSIYFKNLSSPNATKYYWTYGNGNYDTVPNPAVNFPTSGIFDVCLRVLDPVSKVTSQTCQKVPVGAVTCKLNAAFSFYNNPATDLVEFSDQSDGDLAFWYWTFGDGSTSTSQNPDHLYAAQGFYLVTLSVSNSNNQCINSYQEIVKVGNGNCKASFTYFVDETTVTFTNNSTGTNLKYYWSFDNGNSLTDQNPTVKYAKPGIYNVSLTITNIGGTCSDIAVSPVLVGKVDCNATFSYYFDSAQNKVFFSPSNALPDDQLFWTFGDGSTDTSRTPSHEFDAPGYFNVGLSLYNSSGCIDYQQQTLLIGREGIDCRSDFIFSVSDTVVDFTDISKGKPTGYLWNFGDGSELDITQNPSHPFSRAGYYNVCHLIVNKYGISNIKCKPVPVVIQGKTNCLADFNFVVDQSARKATFVNNSIGNPDKFEWNFGDKHKSTAIDTTHIYANANYYLVGLKISNNTTGCSDQTYKIVNITNIKGKIKAGFGYDARDFSKKSGGYPVDFIGVGLGDQSRLRWTFGDSTNNVPNIDSTTTTPSHTYLSPGKYQVCYKISNPITGDSDLYCDTINTATVCTNDTFAPNAICKNITVKLDSLTGSAVITPGMIDNGSSAHCGEVTLSLDRTIFTTADIGTKNVKLTVKTQSNISRTCAAIVTVEGVTSINSLSATALNFNIWPNPMTDFTKISFDLSRSTRVELVVYDLQGKCIETIMNTSKTPGSYNILWNSSQLAKGSYIVLLRTSDGSDTRKLMIKL